MDAAHTGKIDVDGFSHSKAFDKSIRKRVQRWIAAHPKILGGTAGASAAAATATAATPLNFKVSFQREGEGHMMNCRLEIRTLELTLFASQYGDGPLQALNNCLSNLEQRTKLQELGYVTQPASAFNLPGLRRFRPAFA